MPFTVGDAVQTPFGKGVVREVRNAGLLLVEVNGRALVVSASDVSPVDGGRRGTRRVKPISQADDPPPPALAHGKHLEVDLHGLSTDGAIARCEQALNDALLQDVAELRLIHGRSGGRIRAALHAWLRTIPSVRHFRLDPRNAGVTLVQL
jgi:DNA mismatch repair protein MutS2